MYIIYFLLLFVAFPDNFIVAKSVHAVTENQEEYDLRVDTALENATLCIGGVNERIAHAKMQHPELFKK
jgi:hypothetical protein